MTSIQSICVCGAGTMGSGIAMTCAQAGIHTLLYDVNRDMLQKAEQTIEKNLDALLAKQKIPATEKQRVLNHLRFVSDINDCIADIVIEAIVEKTAIKVALFNQLAEVNHSETIFASNTSSLSISQIASLVMHPQRVVGMHFFNPAQIMKLVEVVKATQTTDAVVKTVYDLALQLGKTPVICTDAPGFIVNHVARPYYIEALRLLENQKASIEDIDRLMEASGFKMGPFRLMDLIGNDINYAVSCSVYEQLGKPGRLAPSPIQEEKVRTGQLGKKSGKGYYDYTPKN